MITFRLMTENDLEFFNEVRNSCAEKYLHDSRKFTLEENKKWFANTTNVYYIIEYDKEKIGYFRTSNFSPINKNIYIGSDLHKKYRGLGLGCLAYLAFIPYLFETLQLHKISSEILSSNTTAIKLYRKLRFVEEGRKRDEVKKDDIYIDSIIMSILESEWKKSVPYN